MRVEIEELIALVSDEVVATARSATRYPNRLRQLENGFERSMVDWCDTFDA